MPVSIKSRTGFLDSRMRVENDLETARMSLRRRRAPAFGFLIQNSINRE